MIASAASPRLSVRIAVATAAVLLLGGCLTGHALLRKAELHLVELPALDLQHLIGDFGRFVGSKL